MNKYAKLLQIDNGNDNGVDGDNDDADEVNDDDGSAIQPSGWLAGWVTPPK